MTLGLEMASSSCSVLPANATLADLTLEVRQSGSEIFLAQMRAQRDQLRAILRSDGSSTQLNICQLEFFSGWYPFEHGVFANNGRIWNKELQVEVSSKKAPQYNAPKILWSK